MKVYIFVLTYLCAKYRYRFDIAIFHQ